jgi:glycolate oxidase FAD binding subunit
MKGSADLEGLTRALGADWLTGHAPVEVDGVGFDATLEPPDAAALAAAVATLDRLSVGAVVRGGGTQIGMGNPPRRSASLQLSTLRLAGIDTLDADEGVCHALAGTPLAELAAAAEAEGWELPLDALDPASTLGGALASASVGPRCQGFGRVRDHVLGLEVVLASGERVRCGGRVVKNVTGYDLNKLHTGAFGTLGVIEGAWLRLRPRPERTLLLEAAPEDVAPACAMGLAAARRATARVAALVLPSGGALSLLVELAGDARSVESDAAALRREAGAVDAAPDALERVRRLQSGVPAEPGMRFRLALLVSRLVPALSSLREFGAELLVYPGLGLVFAGYPIIGSDSRATADAAWSRVARVARTADAPFRLESAPAWAKRGHDVFGDRDPAQFLIESLKRRFDPGRVLNPGRFAGHL